MPLKLPAFKALIFALILFASTVTAQQKPVPGKGIIKGLVKDSATMINLPQSTIAVYYKTDTSLIKYRLNDGRGRFTVDGLPIDTGLILTVSYIGYKSYSKNLRLSETEKEITLPAILLSESNNLLQEVIVRLPPMVMRGDTLEFNIDAFKAKPNAVIGDIIRDLPGFVIWGDGQITVNGKKVSQVTVEGKTFFSGDPRISMENLPKTIVDKVQVMPDREPPKNREDTIKKSLKVNITLKKGKKSGIFGKAGGGTGTDSRFEAQVGLAGFNPNSQLSLVAGRNNINLSAVNVGDMLVQSSYRPGALSSKYYGPDFREEGLSDRKSGGLIFNHTLNKKFSGGTEYFGTGTNQNFVRKEISRQILEAGILNSSSEQSNRTNTVTRRASAGATFRDSTFTTVNLRSRAAFDNTNSSFTGNSVTTNAAGSILNKTGSENTTQGESRNFAVEIDFRHDDPNKTRPTKYHFAGKYNFEFHGREESRINKNALETPGRDEALTINRKSGYNNSSTNHEFEFNIYDLKDLLGIRLNHYNLFIGNATFLRTGRENNNVSNFNPATQAYSLTNTYLTNTGNELRFTDIPYLNLSRSFDKSFANRYYRGLNIEIALRYQFSGISNKSQKGFQNISRNYSAFIPAITISARDNQIGRYEQSLTGKYSESIELPEVFQLAPLVDSAHLTYLYFGNRNLKESRIREAELNYNFTSSRLNTFNLNSGIAFKSVEDYIADSSIVTEAGIRKSYLTNLSGFKSINWNTTVRKAFKIREQTFEFSGNTRADYFKQPAYINSAYNLARNISISISGNLMYNLSDWISLNLSREFAYYKLQSLESTFVNRMPRGFAELKFLRISNFTFTTNVNSFKISNYGLPESDILIWNAHVSYRVGKKKQFEAKFSANDLLKENKGIFYNAFGNQVQSGTVNKLQQYFLFGLAYYPRAFGRKK